MSDMTGVMLVCQSCGSHIRSVPLAYAHNWRFGHKVFRVVVHPQQCCAQHPHRTTPPE